MPGGGIPAPGEPAPPGGGAGSGMPDIGGGGQDGSDSMSGGADGDGDSDGDSDGQSGGDCGDSGALPGGVGGMGQDGDCIGGGGAAASSDAAESGGGASGGGASGGSASSAGGAAGGGASGGGGAAGGGGESGGVQGTGGAGGVGEFPGESAEERAERLGRVLDESLGDFDDVLLEEQQEVASVGRNTEGFGGSGGGGGVNLGEQAGDGSGSPVAVVNDAMAPRESPTAGMSDQEVRERTPEDVPMVADDDIIARQLREAALAEEDPELRERLWEEYRKYKGL